MEGRSELTMNRREALETLFVKHEYTEFKWIDAKKIVVSQWVRMKCEFGCGEYGQNASCPPNLLFLPSCL